MNPSGRSAVCRTRLRVITYDRRGFGQSSKIGSGSWNAAIGSAPVAAYAVVPSWIEDFRNDIEAVRSSGKPALILHGTKDNILATTPPGVASTRCSPRPSMSRL
jgi:hypothetical protein